MNMKGVLKASSRKTNMGYKPVIIVIETRQKYSWNVNFTSREDAIKWSSDRIISDGEMAIIN